MEKIKTRINNWVKQGNGLKINRFYYYYSIILKGRCEVLLNKLTIKKVIFLYILTIITSIILNWIVDLELIVADNLPKELLIYFIRNLTVHILMFVLVYYIYLNKQERSVTFKIPSKSKKIHPLVIFIPFIITFTVGVVFNLILSFLPAPDIVLTYNTSKLESILFFIDLVILIPIIEEIIFRRVIFTLLCVNNTSTCRSIIYTSLLFMFVHNYISIPHFIFSIIVTVIYQISGNIKYPILAHMLNNLIFYVMVTLMIINENLYLKLELALGVKIIVLSVISIIWIIKKRNIVKEYLAIDSPVERMI